MLIQVYDAEDVRVLKGVVSKGHVHMHIEYPPSKSISDFVKRLKGGSSHGYFKKSSLSWAEDIGGSICWELVMVHGSAGNITDDLIQEYLEHHKDRSNEDTEDFILE